MLAAPRPPGIQAIPTMPGSTVPGRADRPGATSGVAHWQMGSSAGHSRDEGGVMEPLAWPTGPTRLPGQDKQDCAS